MRLKPFAIGALGVVLGATLLWAGDVWNEKPYTEWTKKEVEKVLEDSPWARSAFANFEPSRREMENPVAQRPLESRLTVQWASSLTIRQATVRQRQLDGTIDENQAQQLLGSTPTELMLILRGRDLSTLRGTLQGRKETLFELEAGGSTFIEVGGTKKRIKATRVQYARNGDRIVAAIFYFPREVDGHPSIGADESKASFHCLEEFAPGAGANIRSMTGSIVVPFDLRKMMRDGKPDL